MFCCRMISSNVPWINHQTYMEVFTNHMPAHKSNNCLAPKLGWSEHGLNGQEVLVMSQLGLVDMDERKASGEGVIGWLALDSDPQL